MENNYSKNLTMLKKCRKIYNIIFRIYFVSCVPPALTVLFVTGLLSICKKELKFTYLPVPVAILLMLVNSFDDMFFLNVITLYFMGTIHIVIAKASLIILTDTEIRPVKRMRYSKIKYQINRKLAFDISVILLTNSDDYCIVIIDYF